MDGIKKVYLIGEDEVEKLQNVIAILRTGKDDKLRAYADGVEFVLKMLKGV